MTLHSCILSAQGGQSSVRGILQLSVFELANKNPLLFDLPFQFDSLSIPCGQWWAQMLPLKLHLEPY